jgi:hypothetical protein
MKTTPTGSRRAWFDAPLPYQADLIWLRIWFKIYNLFNYLIVGMVPAKSFRSKDFSSMLDCETGGASAPL